MPDVISDTSPIQYLHQIELLDLLFSLYETITIPEAGTLGVLLKAKQSGLLVEIRSILDKLEAKGFRLDNKTRAAVLKLAQEA